MISDEKFRRVKELLAEGRSLSVVAKKVGVCRATVGNIRHGRCTARRAALSVVDPWECPECHRVTNCSECVFCKAVKAREARKGQRKSLRSRDSEKLVPAVEELDDEELGRLLEIRKRNTHG